MQPYILAFAAAAMLLCPRPGLDEKIFHLRNQIQGDLQKCSAYCIGTHRDLDGALRPTMSKTTAFFISKMYETTAFSALTAKIGGLSGAKIVLTAEKKADIISVNKFSE